MGIEQLVQSADPYAASPQGHRGVFLSAPASLTTKATVVLDHAEGVKFEDVRWMPRGAVIPDAGDECLIVLDDEGDPWAVAWWPV